MPQSTGLLIRGTEPQSLLFFPKRVDWLRAAMLGTLWREVNALTGIAIGGEEFLHPRVWRHGAG
jgi:hypothetical protein